MKKVIWSVVGSKGQKYEDEVDNVIEIMKDYPNIVGVMFDDFFNHSHTIFGNPKPYYNLPELHELAFKMQHQLDGIIGRRPTEYWTVQYKHLLNRGFEKYNIFFDTYTYWTWKGKDLDDLEADFAIAEKEANGKDMILGCEKG